MPSGHRPQPPVGTARVAITGNGVAGNPWANILWLNITATTHVQADLKSVVDSMLDAWNTRFIPYKHASDNTTGAKASWLYASNSVIEYTGTYTYTGSHSSSEVGDNQCMLIDWAISDYYRGGHPRTYLSGLPSNILTNGNQVDATDRAALATAANNFISDVNALTHGGISAVALGTVRFASGNAWLSPPQFKPYTGASVRPIIAVQRRRLGGR